MPRLGIRSLGIGAVLLLTGCTALNDAAAPVSSPSTAETPAAAEATPGWTENLLFSGQVSGRLTSIVASGPEQKSECSGRSSARAGRWDSAIYGQVEQAIYGVVVTANPYRGPGVYSAPAVTVQVHTTDQQHVWVSQASDAVTFKVAADEESGSLDALLTNQDDNQSKLHVSGTWSCGR